jgi:four helix bundle protein
VFKFEKLDVWKKAVDLHATISQLSRSIDQKDQFSIGEQIRRASLSISTNIAEGTGRESVREARYFFNIAKGSVYEVVSLLYVMRKSGYVADDIYCALYEQCDEIARMLRGMMKR